MNRSSGKWLGRLALILILVCGLDCAVVAFVPHPRPWVVAVSFLIPLLNAIFVILPWTKAHAAGERGANGA